MYNFIGIRIMLFVVFTEREKNALRIISARKATKREIYGYKNDDL